MVTTVNIANNKLNKAASTSLDLYGLMYTNSLTSVSISYSLAGAMSLAPQDHLRFLKSQLFKKPVL